MDSPEEPTADGQSVDDSTVDDAATDEEPTSEVDAASGADTASGADAPSGASDDAAHRLERRRVLALTGTVAAGGLAGCGGGGDGDGGDDTTTEGTTEETTTESTTAPTTEATTTEPTTTTATTEPIEDVTDLVQSPSSNIAPTDGFASAEWLLEEDPQIIKVTNLNAEGEGSLRNAIRTEGPRIVVFEVGGVIDLESTTLEIPVLEGDYGNLFVAGQTAPPPGITVIRGEIQPYAPNTIFQHITVRVGDNVDDAFDSISVGSDAGDTIIDHCTTTWSVDENLSVDGGPDVGGYTLSNNLIAEALDDSVHPKGPHSMGSLINNNAPEVAVIGNIYSSNTQRHPRLKGGTTSAVVNNLVYKFNAGTVMGADSDQPAQSSVVGNRYFTEAGARAEPIIELHDSAEMGEMYVEDNMKGPGQRRLLGQNFTNLDERPLWPEGLEAMPVDDVQDHNHATAGARPAERSAHDQRILEDSRNMEKEFVDSQEAVGGYPELEATERTLDVPEYGQAFADWLAGHTRAVELGEDPPA